MIVQLIALAIFLVSMVLIFLMVSKKIPMLLELPEQGHHGFTTPRVIADVQKKIRDKHFHFFQKKMLLHGILSRSRLLILKLEKQLDTVLSGIRKNAQELDKKTKKRK